MTTFYGTRAFHDEFTGRPGYFDYLLRILAAAEKKGMNKMHVLFVSRSTVPYLGELSAMLSARPGKTHIPYRPIFNKPDVMTSIDERLRKRNMKRWRSATLWARLSR